MSALKPTVAMTGAAVDATRRTATRAPSRTSSGVVPPRNRVASHTSGPMMSGASIVNPTISAIAENNDVVTAASAVAADAVHTMATPRPIAPMPAIQRPTVMARWSTAASRSASSGRTLAVRRATDQTPASATTSPAPPATASTHGGTTRDSPAAHSPARASGAVNGTVMSRPRPTPVTDASRPTTNASANSIRRTWRGVAPTARSRPTSRRR
jgi:hypothetical protein